MAERRRDPVLKQGQPVFVECMLVPRGPIAAEFQLHSPLRVLRQLVSDFSLSSRYTRRVRLEISSGNSKHFETPEGLKSPDSALIKTCYPDALKQIPVDVHGIGLQLDLRVELKFWTPPKTNAENLLKTTSLFI